MLKNDLVKAINRLLEFMKDFDGQAVVTDSLVYAMETEASAIIASTPEDWVYDAEHYLCPSEELTTEEQVMAIADHDDQDDYIDNVKGVIPWERISYEFSCYEFLNLINFKTN